jgi:hypothetical protein
MLSGGGCHEQVGAGLCTRRSPRGGGSEQCHLREGVVVGEGPAPLARAVARIALHL